MQETTLGEKADLLYTLRQQRYALQRQVDRLKEEEASISEELINELPQHGANGIAGGVARVTIKNKEVAIAGDWGQIYDFIMQTGNFQLLQRRLSQSSVDELLADKVDVPGINVTKIPVLSINKI